MAHLQRARLARAAMRGFDERDEGPPFIAVAPLFDVGGIMEQDRRMSAHELLGGPAEDLFGRGIGKLDDAICVGGDDRVLGALEDRLLQGGARAELGLGANAAVDLILKRTVGARQLLGLAGYAAPHTATAVLQENTISAASTLAARPIHSMLARLRLGASE